MQSWKVRLGLVLAMLAMLIVASAPAMADEEWDWEHDDENDEVTLLVVEAEGDCTENEILALLFFDGDLDGIDDDCEIEGVETETFDSWDEWEDEWEDELD